MVKFNNSKRYPFGTVFTTAVDEGNVYHKIRARSMRHAERLAERLNWRTCESGYFWSSMTYSRGNLRLICGYDN